MTILGILSTINNTTFCYSPAALPWSVLKSTQGVSINTIIVLSLENTQVPKFLSLNKLFMEYSSLSLNMSTWDDLISAIDTLENLDIFFVKTLVPSAYIDIVDGVTTMVNTPFFSTMQGQLGYYTLANFSKIAVTEDSNNLRIIKSMSYIFNSNTVIPFINGIACYSDATENYMTIYKGNSLTNTTNKNIRDIVAIDFGELGVVYKYKLSDCQKLYVTGTEKTLINIPNGTYVKSVGSFNTYNKKDINISFLLPKNAVPGIPILCIGGRLFFPKFDNLQIFQSNDRYGISFTLSRDILESILSINLAKQTSTIVGTKVKSINVKSFLDNLFVNKISQNIENEDSTIPFITILQTEHPIYLQPIENIASFEPSVVRFPRKSNGILINHLTRDLFDYVKINYDSETLVTIAENYKKYLSIKNTPIGYTTRQTGFGWHNYNEKDNYNPFNDKKILTDLEKLILLDIGWDNTTIEDSQEEPEEEPSVIPASKITLALCGKLKRIRLVPKDTKLYLAPIDIGIMPSGANIAIIKENDTVSGVYYLEGGIGNTRTWAMSTTPAYRLAFNALLQNWTIATKDTSVIKYQSGLGANKANKIWAEGTTYANPWDNNLSWYVSLNS